MKSRFLNTASVALALGCAALSGCSSPPDSDIPHAIDQATSGQLVADDSLANLRRRARLPIRMVVTAASEHSAHVASRLGGAQVNCRGVELHCDATGKMAHLGRIAELGGMIDDVDVIPPSLEDLYRHYANAEDAS